MYIIVRGAGRLEDAQAAAVGGVRSSCRRRWRRCRIRSSFWTPRASLWRGTNRSSGSIGLGTRNAAAVADARSPAVRAVADHARPARAARNSGVESSSGRLLTARAAHDGHEYEVSRGEMPDGGAVVRCVDVTEKLRDETALRQGQKMEASRPADRRHGARLQQHPAGHPGQSRSHAEPMSAATPKRSAALHRRRGDLQSAARG